jgi:5-(hydroxymethyl)furfural/furfural oxidase
VVVGAGSAGCVLAARLSEDPANEVTLIEAGPDLSPGEVPSLIDGPSFLDALDEPGRTYPNLMASRTLDGPSTQYRRGRGVGGSSAVNAMIALRGDPHVYAGWGWHDADAAWSRVAIPAEVAADDELGMVDQALLAATPYAGKVELTRRDRHRVTAAEAYLWPAAQRSNLSIRTESAVDLVMIEHHRAVGVRLSDGTEIGADRVVLSAGAIHSPTVLLRSGVTTPGVGEGLQDHPSVPFALQLREPVADPVGQLAVATLLQREGIQLVPMNHLGRGLPGLGLLMVAVMRPRGRAGSVRIASADPAVEPVVAFNLLDDQRDVDALKFGARMAIDLLGHESFRQILEGVYIDDQGTTVDALGDGEVLERWVRSAAGDYVHASSSCAMGSVVDDNGEVLGYHQLFVCDASVFPSIPDVNTHLPTTMLAERLVARWRAGGTPAVAG